MYNPFTMLDETDATDAQVLTSDVVEVGKHDHFLVGMVVTDISGSAPLVTANVQYSFDGEMWSPTDGMQISEAIPGPVDTEGVGMAVQPSTISAPLARVQVTLDPGTTASFKFWGYLS